MNNRNLVAAYTVSFILFTILEAFAANQIPTEDPDRIQQKITHRIMIYLESKIEIVAVFVKEYTAVI